MTRLILLRRKPKQSLEKVGPAEEVGAENRNQAPLPLILNTYSPSRPAKEPAACAHLT